MGLTPSKEQLMIKAIENQDIGALNILINDLTLGQKKAICKYIVTNDKTKCTMLHYAVWQDNPDLLALLLDGIDDLETRDGLNWTPLMTAINRGSKENVKILLKHGAKIDCDNVNGMDLIAMAMNFNDIELIEILMDHGAQVRGTVEEKVNDSDPMGCYLLHFAADSGLIDVARLLIDKGKISINTLDQSGWSALHLAAGHNYLDIVKLLLENDADINIKDADGNTPLAWARVMKAEEAINELKKHGGIADEEWHGEKPTLHNFNEETVNGKLPQGIENNQFIIDEPQLEPSSKDKSLLILDALQRQR